MVISLLEHYVLHVVVIVVAVAIVYRVTFRSRGVPSIERTAPREVDRDREEWLLANGYAFLGTYRIDYGTPIEMVMNAFVSSDGVKACGIIRVNEKVVVEFTSRCRPFFVLCLNNFCEGSVMKYPPFKLVLHVREESIAGLSDLYDRLLDECRLRRVVASPLPAGEGLLEEMVVKGSLRDFEHQVRVGRMKRIGENRYRPTMKGAVVGVWFVWLADATRGFARWRRPWREGGLFARLRAKLDEFQSYPQAEIDYTY